MNKRQRKKAALKGMVRQKGGKGYKTPQGWDIKGEEILRFEKELRQAQQLRQRMLNEAIYLPHKRGGRTTGGTVGDLVALGREPDFILARKDVKLQDFETKRDFEVYVKSLNRINKPGYIDERVRLYKNNYQRALQNVFGDQSKDIQMRVRMMKPGEYMQLVEMDELMEIGYIYDLATTQEKLTAIRSALGMRQKDIIDMPYVPRYSKGRRRKKKGR